MSKKVQILMFYISLILIAIALGWNFSDKDVQMEHSLAGAAIALGISMILWQKYGKKMSYQ